MIRTVLVAGAIVSASLMPAVRASATPHMMAAGREPQGLQRQVVRLFDELDQVSQDLESVLAETAWAHERISELSRQIDSRQQVLNRRAVEAYMGELAVGVDSVLGASSIGDLQDSLEFLEAISRRDHEVLLELQRRKASSRSSNGNTPACASRQGRVLRKSVQSANPHPRRFLRVHLQACPSGGKP